MESFDESEILNSHEEEKHLIAKEKYGDIKEKKLHQSKVTDILFHGPTIITSSTDGKILLHKNYAKPEVTSI